MMAGMLLAVISYRPIFSTFLNDTNTMTPGVIVQYLGGSDPIITKIQINDKKDSLEIRTSTIKDNEFSFDIVRTDTIFSSPVKAFVGEEGSNFDGWVSRREGETKHINKKLGTELYWKFIGLVFILILYVTMVYGPIAAFLVEMFPTRIRYTSMSLPYHIGNGVFGGLVPFIGLLLTTTYTKDPLVGLWYPIGVASLCLIIGTLYLNNKIDRNIRD